MDSMVLLLGPAGNTDGRWAHQIKKLTGAIASFFEKLLLVASLICTNERSPRKHSHTQAALPHAKYATYLTLLFQMPSTMMP